MHLDQIEKEDFGDFFEALLIRVSQNHSELKKEAFQRVLGNQLRRPVDVDYNLLCLDLISGLHEKQIPILEKFYDSQADCALHTEWQAKLAQRQKDLVDMTTFNDRMNSQIYAEGILDTGTGTGNLNRLIDERKAEVEAAKVEIAIYRAPFLPVTFGIEPDEFPVLIQDLCNKGLLIDYSTKYAYDPHTLLEISVLGIRLMQSLSDPAGRKF